MKASEETVMNQFVGKLHFRYDINLQFLYCHVNSQSARFLKIHLEMEWVRFLTVTVAQNSYGQAWRK